MEIKAQKEQDATEKAKSQVQQSKADKNKRVTTQEFMKLIDSIDTAYKPKETVNCVEKVDKVPVTQEASAERAATRSKLADIFSKLSANKPVKGMATAGTTGPQWPTIDTDLRAHELRFKRPPHLQPRPPITCPSLHHLCHCLRPRHPRQPRHPRRPHRHPHLYPCRNSKPQRLRPRPCMRA